MNDITTDPKGDGEYIHDYGERVYQRGYAEGYQAGYHDAMVISLSTLGRRTADE